MSANMIRHSWGGVGWYKDLFLSCSSSCTASIYLAFSRVLSSGLSSQTVPKYTCSQGLHPSPWTIAILLAHLSAFLISQKKKYLPSKINKSLCSPALQRISHHFEMTERTKKSTYTYYTESTTQTHNATQQAYSNPPNQSSGTPPSLNPPKNFSSELFIPISRSWGQPCSNSSTSAAMQQPHNGYSTTSTWLSDPQRQQPWNAIGSVPARPFGPGGAENVAKAKKDKKKDSERATRGSAFSAR